MYYSPQFLDEIRNRVKISEVVSKRVALKRAGSGLTGLCPFHNEKTPSFTVSDQKQFYHCFGCGAHGDVITFAIEAEGKSFNEAIKDLASLAGLQLPDLDPQIEKKIKHQHSLSEVMNEACLWYEKNLQSSIGSNALDYLKKRGIDDKLIKKFRLGFAPDNKGELQKVLGGKNIKDKDLEEVGLLLKGREGGFYERFRGRITFPICDVKGNVIAFGGRALGDEMPKYLNSPETVLFKKGEVLYNEHNAKLASFDKRQVIVVEGYMDVIALAKAGIENAVAPLGTAVTEKQVQRLWKMAPEPVFCMDGDNAGQRAMARVASVALPVLSPGYVMRFASLPDGMDPDDLIQKEGRKGIEEILEKALYLQNVLWNIEINKVDITIVEKQPSFQAGLAEIVAKIKNPQVQTYYRKFFDDKFKNAIWKTNRSSFKNEKDVKKIALESIKTIPDMNTIEGCELILTGIVIDYPYLIEDKSKYDEYSYIDFITNKLDKIQLIILEIFNNFGNVDKQHLFEILENEGYKSAARNLESSFKHCFPVKMDDEFRQEVAWELTFMQFLLVLTNTEKEAVLGELVKKEDSKEAEDEYNVKIQEYNNIINGYQKKIRDLNLKLEL